MTNYMLSLEGILDGYVAINTAPYTLYRMFAFPNTVQSPLPVMCRQVLKICFEHGCSKSGSTVIALY
jgi:hypothetical protein